MDISQYLQNEKIDKIIRKYLTLNKIIFDKGVFFLLIIFSIILCVFFVGKIGITPDQSIIQYQEKSLILKFNQSFLRDTSYDQKDIKVHLAQGFFEHSGGTLRSLDNLVTYKGYVLPKYFLINTNVPLKDQSYFEDENYDIFHLQQFIENFVFIKNPFSQEIKYPNLSLALDENIFKKFNLNCLLRSPLVYKKVCNFYLNNFFQVGFVYNLENDIKGLTDLFLTIRKKYKDKHFDKFCQTLDNYIRYSNNTDESLGVMISYCDNENANGFYLLQGFVEIQKQLLDGYISKNIYSIDELNIYKLLSYQEIIYNDFLGKNINISRLNFYVDFLEEALKKGKIQSFYLDVTYLFNNDFVLKNLRTLRYSDAQKQSELKSIIERINKLNFGSNLLGFEGLESQIKNSQLKNFINKDLQYTYHPVENHLDTGNLENKMEKSFEIIKNLSFLSIVEQNFEDNKIEIVGYIKVDNTNFYGNYNLIFSGENFFVQNVNINGQKNLNEFLNISLENKNFSFVEFYDYLKSSAKLYLQEEKGNKSEIFCMNLSEKLFMYDISLCDENKISVLKKDGKNTIEYSFSIDDYQITDIKISDELINAWFEKKLKDIESDELTLMDYIYEIVLYQDKNFNPDQLTRTGSNDTIIIVEKVQKYLGIIVKDIAEKNGKYAFEFSIKGINFVCLYDIQNHILGPIYFKDVRVNNDEPYIIRNFYLALNDENINVLNEFLFDPMVYIQKVSPISYTKYIENEELKIKK